jgi:hypothetical protein
MYNIEQLFYYVKRQFSELSGIDRVNICSIVTDFSDCGGGEMGNGPGLVIRGTIMVSLVLVIFCLSVTARISFPSEARAEILTENVNAPVAESAPATVEATVVVEPVSCAVSSRYPAEITQWCALITRYAQQFGLPPDLVAGLVWLESGGNPEAYSHSGAVGLMQVMPRDGLAAGFICRNGPCFANRPSSSELYDPEFNIKYGTRMLAGLLTRHGSFREALRAYGPMDVGYSYADKVLGIYERHRN